MDAKEKLKSYKTLIDVELKKYLEKKIKEASTVSPYAKELVEHIADLTLRGGKRIRPALAYYSYIACGGKDREAMLKSSMAIEFSETYLLIHDDIMDDDTLRRGGITIHESYRLIAQDLYQGKNPKSFGDSMGINAGDLACAMSNEILANSSFEPKLVLKAISEFSKVYSNECMGQILDVISQLRDDVKQKDVIQIHQLKTVPYTFDGPVRIGAILAGADKKTLDQLSLYTVPLGTAFQIQDDILGMFGDEEKVGKPVTSDLTEGKKTLLIIDALEKGDDKQKETILVNLGNVRTTYKGLQAVRKAITDTGALQKSKDLAEKLVKDSIDSLEKIKLKKEGKEFLFNIAEFMIKREC